MNLLPSAASALAIAAIAVLAACTTPRPAPRAAVAAPPASAASAASGYPFAASRTQTRDVAGVTVSEDFAWLENAADPATRAWIMAENALARRHLDAMPAHAALRERLQSLAASTANAYSSLVERGGFVFALEAASPAQRPVLVALKSVDDVGGERVLFDPAEAAPDGPLAIVFFRPSTDGRKVVLALSSGDEATLRVLDVGTGQLLPDRIADGGDAAWTAGNAGFFFTRRPEQGGAQIVFHAIGAAQDRVDLADGLPRGARVRLQSARDGRHVLALVEDAAGVSLWLKPANANGEGAWRRLAVPSDGVRDAQFGDDDALWIRSVANAPRGKLLRVPLTQAKAIAWDRLAAVAVPQQGSLQRFAVAGGTVMLAEGEGATSRLRSIDLRTKRGAVVALPSTNAVAALVRVGRGEVLAQVTGPLAPPLWMRVAGGRARRTSLVTASDASFDDSELVREVANSRDGTSVPLDILRRKGTRLDGRNPVLLEIGSAAAGFDVTRRVWLDRGGVVALATLRADRHDARDDFSAAAELLVRRGYTQPSLLGVRASGEGALAAAEALTAQPALFRALVGVDGRYDLMPPPSASAEAAAVDHAQAEALLADSPLHAVRDGVDYPAVLLRAGGRGGVDAAQSRKMAARLQQADPHGRAILLLTETSSGQGATAPDRAADELGFLLDELVAAQ